MNDREVEDLLRARPEPLEPPAGRWETVRRRARRRRIAKLGAVLSAALVVAAGAGIAPTVLFSHGKPSEQRLSIAAGPTPPTRARHAARSAAADRPTPSPTPAAPLLRGFEPSSVSFVSQLDGFLLGSSPGGSTVVARTFDGGASWSELARVPVPAASAGIRFATGTVGFVFGAGYLVTGDGGASWQAEPSPGFISDLETMNGHVYALVSRCARCRPVSLWSATTASPALERVAAVPDLTGDSVSLAVHDDAAYVLDTGTGTGGEVWSTLDGTVWAQRPSPCGPTTGLITEWSDSGVAVACDVRRVGAGKQPRRAYVSTDGALTWTALATPPAGSGRIDAVSASGPDDVIVGDDRSGLDVTTDGGRHWSLQGPLASDGARFVGFISGTRVVALPGRAADHLFTTSYDAGLTWTTTRFPR